MASGSLPDVDEASDGVPLVASQYTNFAKLKLVVMEFGGNKSGNFDFIKLMGCTVDSDHEIAVSRKDLAGSHWYFVLHYFT